MDINTLIYASRYVRLSADESKIPWDEPAFSQRMLANHLSQDHDWASRRQEIIEQQVEWIASQLSPGAHILDLGCGPGLYPPLSGARISLHRRGFLTSISELGPPAGTKCQFEHRLYSAGYPRILAG